MKFEDFLGYVVDPTLRDIARHWNDVRGSRRMPAWSDIRPAAIARHLQYVWYWRYDRAARTFNGRLMGQQIVDSVGTTLRNKDIPAFVGEKHQEEVSERLRTIVERPCYARSEGRVLWYAGGTGSGERVALPLAEDGNNADGIFGGTVYRLPKVDAEAGLLAPIKDLPPAEYFDLD